MNFYPTSKRRSVYVQGTQYGENDCTAARAIDLAIDGPPKRWLTKRKDSYARQRRSMLRWKPFCHWCERGLTESTATVDHIVPLSRGGSNYRNNLVLACGPCNAKRADSCGAPKSE